MTAKPGAGSEGSMDPEATVVMQDVPPRPAAEGGDPVAALSAAEAKAEGFRGDYLRALAELDNVRKRAQRDVESAHRYGLERFAQELLAVKDSLEMGYEAAAKAVGQVDALQTLLSGQEATVKLLAKAFEKFNIKEINPLGAPFDPQQHEAMTLQPSATAEPNSVLLVVQKGYQLNDRLLRPARVVVARAPD